MLVKELNFSPESHLNWYFVVDIFLCSVDNANIAQLEVDLLVHDHFTGRGSFVHDIYLGDNSDCAFSILVPLSSQLQTVADGQVLVSRDHTENDGLGISAVTGSGKGYFLAISVVTRSISFCPLTSIRVMPGKSMIVRSGQSLE